MTSSLTRNRRSKQRVSMMKKKKKLKNQPRSHDRELKVDKQCPPGLCLYLEVSAQHDVYLYQH